MKIQLSKENCERLLQPVIGSGGFQSLLRITGRAESKTDCDLSGSDRHRHIRQILDLASPRMRAKQLVPYWSTVPTLIRKRVCVRVVGDVALHS